MDTDYVYRVVELDACKRESSAYVAHGEGV
jgi:hypothetical protein